MKRKVRAVLIFIKYIMLLQLRQPSNWLLLVGGPLLILFFSGAIENSKEIPSNARVCIYDATDRRAARYLDRYPGIEVTEADTEASLSALVEAGEAESGLAVSETNGMTVTLLIGSENKSEYDRFYSIAENLSNALAAAEYPAGRNPVVLRILEGSSRADSASGTDLEILVKIILYLSLWNGLYNFVYLIVYFKMFDTIKRFIISPISRTGFISGVTISSLIFVSVVFAAVFATGVIYYRLEPPADLPVFFMFFTLGNILFIGIGLIVANFSKTITAASLISNVILAPNILFGILYLPGDLKPGILRSFCGLSPTTRLMNVLKSAYSTALPGTDVFGFLSVFAVLIVGTYCVVFMTLDWKRS